MNRLPGRSAAASLISISLLMRMLVGLAIDFPNAANASWMCPLLGFIIFLPFLFALRQTTKLANLSPWENVRSSLPRFLESGIELLFAVFLIYDAASLVRLAASSYNVLALNHVTVHLLIFPLGLSIAIVILLGINAAGYSARIALNALPLLLFILLCVQFNEYLFSFLTPAFGPGFESILAGSIACAGNMAMISLIWFIAQPDHNQHGLFSYVFFPALGTALLLAALHAGYPSMPAMDFTRASRIELVLSNGRMSLAPQFLLNILWYGGLLYLLAAEVCTASCWLRFAFPGLSVRAVAVIEAAVISTAAIYNPWWLQQSTKMNAVMYSLIGAFLALTILTAFIKRKGPISCEN